MENQTQETNVAELERRIRVIHEKQNGIIAELKQFPVNDDLVNNAEYKALMETATKIYNEYIQTHEQWYTALPDAENDYFEIMEFNSCHFDSFQDFARQAPTLFHECDYRQGITLARALEIVELIFMGQNIGESRYLAGGSHNLTGVGGFPKYDREAADKESRALHQAMMAKRLADKADGGMDDDL